MLETRVDNQKPRCEQAGCMHQAPRPPKRRRAKRTPGGPPLRGGALPPVRSFRNRGVRRKAPPPPAPLRHPPTHPPTLCAPMYLPCFVLPPPLGAPRAPCAAEFLEPAMSEVVPELMLGLWALLKPNNPLSSKVSGAREGGCRVGWWHLPAVELLAMAQNPGQPRSRACRAQPCAYPPSRPAPPAPHKQGGAEHRRRCTAGLMMPMQKGSASTSPFGIPPHPPL